MNKKTEELKNMWFEKGCNYWTSGNYDLADECFDEALALDKNDPLSWYNKGTSLLHNEQYNDAIFCFKNSLELDSNQLASWGNITMSYGMIGDDKSALECADRGLDINNTDPDLWKFRGMALRNLGKESEAKFSFSQEEKFRKMENQETASKEEKPWWRQIVSKEEKSIPVYGKKKKSIRSILGEIPNTEEAKSELFLEFARTEDARIKEAEAALHGRLSEDDREKAYKWSAYYRGLIERDSEN
tara:strand:+ start:7664 stop:8395 length:732 start_codon:yes stop_codon:yes gene_type:complete